MNSKKVIWILWGSYACLILYWMFRLWGCFPAFADTLEYVYPEKWFNVESFGKGQIPLWNPYIACGTPHLANWQSAFFYPFFWIWNLTGLPNWFTVIPVLHGAWASAGFYLWLRSQKISPLLSSLCALSFGGSALIVIYWGFPTHLAALSWVPWIFWATNLFFREPSVLTGGLVGLIWSFQILAGYPFFTFYTVLFSAVFIFENYHPKVAQCGTYAAIGGGALLLTACQWLPFLDFMGYLHREGWGENIFSLRWINFLTLFKPQILGVPGISGYQGDYPNFIFNNIYLGLVPLGWFFWSLLTWGRFRESFWRASALFWFFWIAGVHFFVWKVLPERWMQVLEPSKASFLFLFCALTSVGFTLQEKAMFSSKKNGFFKWAWVFGAIWLLDILWVPGRVIHPVSNPYADPAVAQGSAKIKQLAREGRVVSLRPEDYTPPDVSDLTDFFRQKIQTLTPNTNVVQGIRSVGGYLSIYVDGFQNILKYLKWRFPYDGRVLDAAGGRLFVLPQPLRAFKYQVAEREGLSVLTTNAGAMGNAWEVENIREFPDRAHVFEALLDPKAFLENELYTEKSPGGGAVRLEPDVHDSRGVGSVGWWDRWSGFWQRMWGSAQAIKDSRPSPCRADFDVNFEKKGFLVFDEAFCPGWHSWVDGRPQTIFRAYGFWMAVMVPEEGVHQITFRYEPVSFRLGLFLSLLTSVALGVGFYLKRRQLLENLLVPFLKI